MILTQIQTKLDVVEEFDEDRDLTRVTLYHPLLQGELFFFYDQCLDKSYKKRLLERLDESLAKDIKVLGDSFKDLTDCVKTFVNRNKG